ncbi:hypothetical protein [Enterovibrio paralichthyis]|uniref:hypothetical protein n=1 Tax=Enterovibrio paralichthyis TaxID=2853805 RepID=UPI001C460FC5|nr:hypothetical protein [Enterovibrio paralichthyis]MBV7298186.1 hypothetical protein [Enterovibrio paralichthyis]
MFWKKKKNQDINLEEKMPKAGETRDFFAGEAVFFSPKPLPSAKIDITSVISSPTILECNDTYLNIGQRNQGKAWQVQMSNFLIGMAAIVILIILIMFGFEDISKYGSFLVSFLSAWYDLAEPLIIIFTFLYSICWYVVIKSSFDFSRQRPIRLNRERREICYYSDKEKKPIIAPWEEVVCWVAMNRGTTGNSLVTHFTFALAIPTSDRKDYWILRRPITSISEGQRMWETMRIFMDEPKEMRPVPTPFVKEDRAYFDQCRSELWEKFRKGPKRLFTLNSEFPWVSYTSMFFYYVFHILSGWKLPYLVSEWTDSLAKVKVPDDIEAWSQPIPESEWAKPSEELLKQKAAIEKHFEAGGTLTDFVYSEDNSNDTLRETEKAE